MYSCNDTLDVALVCMPFASHRQPSLALSLLKSCVVETGRSAQVYYFNLSLAELAGEWLYNKIATWHIVDLLGDWIFAEAMFGSDMSDGDSYIEDILEGRVPCHSVAYFGKEPIPHELAQELISLRRQMGAFLEKCCGIILQRQPRVVGFTSLFHQHVASLALAQRIKAALPSASIIFGGPSCRSEMGLTLVRQFAFVDAVVSGEGELVLPEIVERTYQGRSISGLPGVFARDDLDHDGSTFTPAMHDMDSLPYPDFSDFVSAWTTSSVAKEKARILFETSRGCWWGQKHRCTFCGQASESLAYRKKSLPRIHDELKAVTQGLPSDFDICVTDEAVDRRTIQGLASCQSSDPLRPDIIYIQVRPDLGKKELKSLKSTGVQRIEAGVETLSTRILDLIGKGTTGLKNIAFIRWCHEVGIEPVWNLLWAFPGEPEDAYDSMARLVPLIVHLNPPNYAGPFRLERFSPYFEQADRYGLRNIAPYPSYSYVYPFAEQILSDMAYYFTFDYQQPQGVERYTRNLAEAIDTWKRAHKQSHLEAVDCGDVLIISDGRGHERRSIQLTGLQKAVYMACDGATNIEQLQNTLLLEGAQYSKDDLESSIKPLIEQGLMLREGCCYLRLALIA